MPLYTWPASSYNNQMKRFFLPITLLFIMLAPGISRAQQIAPDKTSTVRAQVVEIVEQDIKKVPGTDTNATTQTLKAEILEGPEKGKVVTVQDDYVQLDKGEIFYLTHTAGSLDGRDTYSVSDPYRLPAIYFFIGLFVLAVVIFGGKQGIRGLVALVASFLFIGYFMLPGIAHGYSPILVSISVASLIIVLGSYITHGVSRSTTSAVIGMIITVAFTGLLAFWAIKFARLTGFNTEETVYLNFDTQGKINFTGLLLGGIIIGLLGVLYDAAIGQAVAVEELHNVGPHLPRRAIFKRALRIGREHIGALVNTLAIAYVGVSLPLILLFYSASTGSFASTINQEIFATEIIRTMIGSIGLVLAVPITTLIATFMLVKPAPAASPEAIKKEEDLIEELGHKH
jgi:uncharacterized membrane protein